MDRNFNKICIILLLLYGILVVNSFGPRFFDPNCSTNDLQQQGFQFYRINHPDIFKDDLVYRSMRAYLPPLHYALGNLITWPTDNPVITGHVIMSLQLIICCSFLFLITRRLAGFIPACAVIIWYLHSRPLMELMAGGLPRGWIGPILSAYLYALIRAEPARIWATLLIGSLLNPVAVFIAMVTQSFYLLYRLSSNGISRIKELRSEITTFALGAPLVGLVTWLTTARDPELGAMATFHQASRLMGFSRIGGRFPLLPFPSSWLEFKTTGLQVFLGTWDKLSNSSQELSLYVLALAASIFVIIVWRKGAQVISPALAIFGIAIIFGYFLARHFAFKLYIPDRYFATPLGLFFILFVTTTLWNALAKPVPNKASTTQLTALFSLILLVFLLSGSGLKGNRMFDVCYTQNAALWNFVKSETPADAVIAGQPTILNGVQLFGRRIGYMTTETAHPFYNRYYAEVKRRVEISFRAHYAQDWQSLYNLLKDEKIDYFVFQAADFKEESIHRAGYDLPFLKMVKKLSAHPLESYVYTTLPKQLDRERFPFLVHVDQDSAVIDVKALGEHLAKSSAASSSI